MIWFEAVMRGTSNQYLARPSFPTRLTGLGLFVAFVQTLVFTLLSMIYISEVSHAPHEHVHGGEHSPKTGEAITTAHV